MPYKIAKPGRLVPPTTYPTSEEAVSAGRILFAVDNGKPGEFESFKVQAIRPVTLGEFANPSIILGDMKESMAEKCGNDAPMDGVDIGRFSADLFEFLSSYADLTGMDLSNSFVIEGEEDVTYTAIED